MKESLSSIKISLIYGLFFINVTKFFEVINTMLAYLCLALIDLNIPSA